MSIHEGKFQGRVLIHFLLKTVKNANMLNRSKQNKLRVQS